MFHGRTRTIWIMTSCSRFSLGYAQCLPMEPFGAWDVMAQESREVSDI